MSAPPPEEIRLNPERTALTLTYGAEGYTLSAEFLRVHSPSAEVRGHGRPVLQTGKRKVLINGLLPAGNYALKITFSDGHDSGLYDWGYLYRLATKHDALWQDYLAQLAAAAGSRD